MSNRILSPRASFSNDLDELHAGLVPLPSAPHPDNIQDHDAFAHVDDELTDREIDAMFVADMQRRDRKAAAAAKPRRLIRLSWVLRTDAPGKFGFDGRHDAFANMADAEAAFRDVARYPANWYEVALQTSTDGLTWRSWEWDRAAGAA